MCTQSVDGILVQAIKKFLYCLVRKPKTKTKIVTKSFTQLDPILSLCQSHQPSKDLINYIFSEPAIYLLGFSKNFINFTQAYNLFNMQVPLSQERENIKREAESENEIFMGWLSIISITKKKRSKIWSSLQSQKPLFQWVILSLSQQTC